MGRRLLDAPKSKDQLARAGTTGVHGSQHYIALIEGEHGRIGTVIEKHLERVPTMLRDADDQHVVIIAQKVAAASVGNRAPPHGEGASRGVLSSARIDGGGGLQCAMREQLQNSCETAPDLAAGVLVAPPPPSYNNCEELQLGQGSR